MLDDKIIFLVILLAIIYFVFDEKVKENFSDEGTFHVKLYSGKCKRLSDIRMQYNPFNYKAAEREFEYNCKNIFEGKPKPCTYGKYESGRRCQDGNDEIYKEKMEDAKKISWITGYDIEVDYN
jgi:hypothetical protein